MNLKKSFINEIVLRVVIIFVLFQALGIMLFLFSSLTPPELILKKIFYIIGYEVLTLLLIVFVIANYFKKRFERSLSEIVNSMDEVKTGNLPSIVAEGGYVETEDLRDSINSLLNHFNQFLRRTFHGLQQLSTAIKQIRIFIEGLGKNTKKQTDLIGRVDEALKRSDSSKKEILNSTQNLTTLSEDNVSVLTEITSSGKEIEESTKHLFDSSTNIHSTILEISKAANEIAKNMENLSVSVEQTSAAVDELTASFKEIERSTKESVGLTGGVRNIASDGMVVVAEAMDGMEEISLSVNKSVEMIRQLGQKSKEIEKILTAISDITKKTNLLSLNAAILSSQAGEEGRVFSVVADEIKILADKTRASAKEITEIIKSTQKDIASTLKVSEESLKTVEHGTGLVIKAGEALREVINLARQSAEAAATIQKATQEQVMGVSQINKSMEIIKKSVEDVTKATFMQERGSRHILVISEKIKEISSTLMRGIEEQNNAVQMMLRNLQLTSEKVKHITNEILESEQSDRELISSIENINTITKEIIATIQDINNSFNRVYKEATNFIKGLEGFSR